MLGLKAWRNKCRKALHEGQIQHSWMPPQTCTLQCAPQAAAFDMKLWRNRWFKGLSEASQLYFTDDDGPIMLDKVMLGFWGF